MGIGNPVHLMFIAAVALIVLGPKRLPDLVRSLGNGIFQSGTARSRLNGLLGLGWRRLFCRSSRCPISQAINQ